jgi:hypothetical protein
MMPNKRRAAMKQAIRNFQKNMMAAAFAEAGEWVTARNLAPQAALTREPAWWQRIFVAVTFAEANLHAEATGMLQPARVRHREPATAIAEGLGLKGVQLRYGTVSI